MNRRLLVQPLISEAEAFSLVREQERQVAAGFSEARRREYLTWRALVRRELGDITIGYNQVGAPVVVGEKVHIGVSHGAGRVAVCISDSPCGVDIESLSRNFDRVKARYLSPHEAALSNDAHFPALVWCAKEVLYKLSAEQELDLLHDLKVTAVGVDWIEGSIKDQKPLRLRFCYPDADTIVVWHL